ncbi:MAG: hypothetical protein P8100_01025, partial [bacterium]
FLLSQEIDSVLYQKTWLDQETRIINGYAVTKDFGQLTRNPAAYNFLPITSVSYKDADQLAEELSDSAQDQNWGEKKLQERIRELQDEAPGGQLQIYISRYNENEANFRWFFVIIRGEDDKGKLWEKEIGYQAPRNPYERGWWNYTTLNIPFDLKPPFYVYLNQKNSKYLSDFRFHIEKRDETEELPE